VSCRVIGMGWDGMVNAVQKTTFFLLVLVLVLVLVDCVLSVRTEYSASMPSLLVSLNSSTANTKVSRYWSAISWYSASEICAGLRLLFDDSVLGGSGSELPGRIPFEATLEVENCAAVAWGGKTARAEGRVAMLDRGRTIRRTST
jgi:hypothetical protein